jgi:hypothetical protein
VADDRWDDGQAYESYIGRWSRPVAARFAVETVAIEVPTVFVDFD